MIMKATIRSMGKNEKWRLMAANSGMAVDDDEFINFLRVTFYYKIKITCKNMEEKLKS